MLWLGLVLLAVLAMVWMATRAPKQPEMRSWEEPPSPPPVPSKEIEDEPLAAYAERVAKRDGELTAIAVLHGPALVCLLAVARADGRVSRGEETEMFDFLARVGVRDHRAGVIGRVREKFSGTRREFDAGVAQIQDEPGYREATLRAMELIIERGDLAHPAELDMIQSAAAAWGLQPPKFFMPVGTPLK